MAFASRKLDPGQETNNDVDYVVLFRFGDIDKSAAVQKFNKLIETLSHVGFDTVVRNGQESSLLVFVRLASEQQLYGEVYRSRIHDWLHGVRTDAPEKDTKKALEKDPLLPGERLRIVYQLIINPQDEGGAGITPKIGEWKNVEAVFALHDHNFNKAWIRKWASSYTLKVEDLDEIRDRFGERIAFYFAFTQAYFIALIGIAVVGIGAWSVLGSFSPIYAVINTLLCVGFIEYWKFQQEDLAIRWGTKGVSSIEIKRHDFQPEKSMTDPVTGEEVKYFPTEKRLRRQVLQIPFALAAATALGTVIVTCFAIEIFVSEVYDGPGKGILVFLPTGILTTMQPLILGILTDLAHRLTLYENYETDGAFEAAMTQKIFVLNFITSYMGICLTAFVYVPFASILIPYLDVFQLIAKRTDASEKAVIANFHINPERLKKQVIYFTVTAQIVNQILEVVVPYIKKMSASKIKEVQTNRAIKQGKAVDVAANDPPEEAAFLKRVRKEVELDVYDVTTDFREMIVQYGYLTMFSVVWPLTSVSFLINNWIELRTDAIKICAESQMPTPWRAEGIGPWLDSLGFLTWIGSITTAAIVYMFSDGGPEGSPHNIVGWALMLSIFFSEHTYLVIRFAAQYFMSKLDSPGRQKQRAERYEVRRKYLEEAFGSQSAALAPRAPAAAEEITRSSLEDAARHGTLENTSPTDRFWHRQRGWEESAKVGATLIEQTPDAEAKKTQ